MSRCLVALVALLLSLPFAAVPAAAASGDHAPPPGSDGAPQLSSVVTVPCPAGGDIPVDLPRCLDNEAGSIRVTWTEDGLIDAATAAAVMEAADLGMTRYRGLGLTAATIDRTNVLNIRVQPGDDSPAYSWKTGTVWIGAVAAKKLVGSGEGVTAESRLELWHELFHWIEDEHYYMGWARINGDYTWWLETAAEVGVGLIDANGLERNATLYGRSTLDDMRTLVTQIAPYQWIAAEQYGQALLVRANICDEGCPMTQPSFVAAINAGTYPLQAADARAKVRRNMQRYATYLLTGRLPGLDTNAPLAAGRERRRDRPGRLEVRAMGAAHDELRPAGGQDGMDGHGATRRRQRLPAARGRLTGRIRCHRHHASARPAGDADDRPRRRARLCPCRRQGSPSRRRQATGDHPHPCEPR